MFPSLLYRAMDGLGAPLARTRDRCFAAWLLVALLVLCAYHGAAMAAENASVSALSKTGLDYEIAVLADETGQETIDTIAGMSASRFRKLNGPLSAGYTRKAHWLRVTVRRGAESPSRWLLELGPGYLDDVRLFTPEPGQSTGFRERRAGDLLPFAAREVVHRHFVFRMEFPESAAPYTFYLRLQSTSTLLAFIQFWQESQFMAEIPAEYLVLGAFLGLFCLMLVYSATYWYILRERYLILFVALVVSMLIAYFGINGLAEQFLFPMHPRLANLFAPIGSCLLVLFGFWFFLDFLQVRQRHPWLSKVYLASMFLSLLAIPGVFLDYYVEIAPLLMLVSLLSLPLCLVVAWRSVKLDILGSRWVASAYAWYCVMVAFSLVSVLGVASSQKFVVFGWQYGAPVYIIFLMSGVLTRVREMERRRDQAIARSIAAEAKADIAHAQREEKSKFLSLMAHELKTPLVEIDAAVQALGYAHTGQEADVLRRYQRIRGAVSRLNVLLEDSLAVVLNEADSDAPFFFRPNRVVLADLWRTLHAAYAESRFDNVRFTSAPAVEFIGDGTLLRLAIGNLLDNALKYGVVDQPITVSVREQVHSDCGGIAFEVESAFAGPADEDFEALYEIEWVT